MEQDVLILIYAILHTIILAGIIGTQIIKEKKIKFELVVICLAIIFIFSIGLVSYFYLLLFWALLQLFIKNCILIQVLLNIPMFILTYKLVTKSSK